METKPLLYGLIGFFIGGFIVSVAATQLDSNDVSDMTMSQMTRELKDKRGDAFDEAFIEGMIEHHEGAVDMAKLSETNAKHNEIKQLSKAIVFAQEAEIEQMKNWQMEWNYDTESNELHMSHSYHLFSKPAAASFFI